MIRATAYSEVVRARCENNVECTPRSWRKSQRRRDSDERGRQNFSACWARLSAVNNQTSPGNVNLRPPQKSDACAAMQPWRRKDGSTTPPPGHRGASRQHFFLGQNRAGSPRGDFWKAAATSPTAASNQAGLTPMAASIKSRIRAATSSAEQMLCPQPRRFGPPRRTPSCAQSRCRGPRQASSHEVAAFGGAKTRQGSAAGGLSMTPAESHGDVT